MTHRQKAKHMKRVARAAIRLSDLYDADRRATDSVVARLAAEMTVPHPLHEVRYADGVLADTTAGRVCSHGRRVTW